MQKLIQLIVILAVFFHPGWATAGPPQSFNGTIKLVWPGDGGTLSGTMSGTILATDGSIVDAGAKPDAAVVADAGVKPDATVAVDAGIKPDAGTPPSDAGLPPVDAGLPPAGGGPNGIYDPVDMVSGLPQGLVFPAPPLNPPAAGQTYTDPVFGTRIRRALDKGAHVYAQLQAFSDDDKMIMLIQGDYAVYNYPAMTVVKRFNDGEYGALRWLPGPGHRVVYIRGAPVRVYTRDLDTGVETLVVQMTYKYAYTAQTYEEVSYDGKYTVVFAHNDSGPSAIVGIDIVNKKLMPWSIDWNQLYTSGVCKPDPEWGAVGVNWTRASPSGKYLMIQWDKSGTGRCNGLEIWDWQTGIWVRHIHDTGIHSDIALTPQGREFVATLSTSPANHNYPALAYEWLDDGSVLSTRMIPWATTAHHSCIGTTSICVTDGWETPGSHAFASEIWTYDMAGNARHLAHHRSNSATYWSQPSPSISRSGKYVTFNTNWGVGNEESTVYVIELP